MTALQCYLYLSRKAAAQNVLLLREVAAALPRLRQRGVRLQAAAFSGGELRQEGLRQDLVQAGVKRLPALVCDGAAPALGFRSCRGRLRELLSAPPRPAETPRSPANLSVRGYMNQVLQEEEEGGEEEGIGEGAPLMESYHSAIRRRSNVGSDAAAEEGPGRQTVGDLPPGETSDDRMLIAMLEDPV